jgi:serine/threonine protein kinase
MTSCPDDDTLAALRDAALDAAERDALMVHLDACAECRAVVAAAARASTPDASPPREPGAVLGRYVILETVGAGAMGVVYAAYDPELGRKVALKLLRSDPFVSGAVSDPRARLLREAQALAKLSHPNVITIHDVGTLDGEVFLAMEFVEQGTLRAWLRAEPRGFRAVLSLLVQAGEGLCAAHEAGLVHRDFKPDNVLVGADGRARVTDFGLVRFAAAPAEPLEELASPARLRIVRARSR